MAFSIVEQNKILNVLSFDENTVSKTNVNVFVSVVFFVTNYLVLGLIHTEEKETVKTHITSLMKVFTYVWWCKQ